jgi:hypothetical protein
VIKPNKDHSNEYIMEPHTLYCSCDLLLFN